MGSKNFGETSKYYFIFTRELGMVLASASGVRKLSSKLRYVLQDFSYLKIDLVKGKDFWRITSASKTNVLDSIVRPETLPVLSNMSRLLRRLLAGEGANEKLFEDFLSGLSLLENSSDEEEIKNIEVITALRILNHLGYIGAGAESQDLVISPFGVDLLHKVSLSRKNILNEINRALKETHL